MVIVVCKIKAITKQGVSLGAAMFQRNERRNDSITGIGKNRTKEWDKCF